MTQAVERPATHAEPAASKFLSGRCSFTRFRVNGPHPTMLSEGHIESLERYKAGRQRIASADGIECGWSAGGHILDTSFGFAKNIVNDCLVFDLRIDTDKPPADRLKAYYEIELKAIAANNPSGFASAKQKREAKELARERLEQEGKDGRFIKKKCIPCLWDIRRNEVLFGSPSLAQIGRFTSMFRETFGVAAEIITAGTTAHSLAEIADNAMRVQAAKLSPFIADTTPPEVCWDPSEEGRDFLGNEFAMWLWYYTEEIGDTLTLADDSEAAVMLSKVLSLECPRSATGTDTIRHEMPSRLPEAKRAAQAGKLPRKIGVTAVRHNDTYEFVLGVELFTITGLKLPPVGEDAIEPRARCEARVDQLRDFTEMLNGVYEKFIDARLGSKWPRILEQMQEWLRK